MSKTEMSALTDLASRLGLNPQRYGIIVEFQKEVTEQHEMRLKTLGVHEHVKMLARSDTKKVVFGDLTEQQAKNIFWTLGSPEIFSNEEDPDFMCFQRIDWPLTGELKGQA